jgi:hypothetical protein
MSRVFTSRALGTVATLAVLAGIVASEWHGVRAYTLIGASYPGSSVAYKINPNFVDASAGTTAQQVAAIQAAADGWQSQTGMDFSFQYAGETTIATVGYDGTNTVLYSHTDGGGALAVCYYWMGGGTMYQFDVQFFDRDGAYNFVWAHTPTVSQFDIQSVAAHEFGHALGLGHSAVLGATMYPSVAPGDTSPRSLHADDVAGAVTIYGVAPPVVSSCSPSHVFVDGGGTVTITGQNFTSTSLAIRFAGVTASNPVYVSPTQVTCTPPPSATGGAVAVEVCCGGQCGSASVFTYDTIRLLGTLTVGGVVALEFRAPSLPNRMYQGFASLGAAGIPLSQYADPADTRVLPVSYDPLLVATLSGYTPWFWNFHSQLDAQGSSIGNFGVHTDPSIAGTTVYFTWLVWEPSAQSGVAHVGNSISAVVQ